ncbi:MBL fold metallo-hydrolase [Sebaldella sp. S0638]|uniref:MBL fold metallo-hydrolase n=1 Tax=Sebaldella sp. S0638 TaxID=2957809 RepID=UPI00209CFD93|nr:MBL fold metallo-hydrolase [Sebaldella sp. S0638]MCP1224696.1 MBL fold metallo-hydrolase [Sebaldella sp. S0638]
MYILIISVIIAVLAYLRYFPLGYDEEKHIEEIMNQNKKDFYSGNFRKRYFNPWKKDNRNIFHSIKWFLEKKPDYNYEKGKYFPKNNSITAEELKNLLNSEKDFIIWIGHNTTLIKLREHFFLCDPVFSEKIFFTKRRTRVGIDVETLNKAFEGKRLNVLITHNHYDHLDMNSLKKLNITGYVYMPAGVKKLFRDMGIKEIREMNWRESTVLGGLTINFLPAQHYSHRIAQGKNRSLWGSYIIETESGDVFIGGDSGYFGGYKEFGERFNVKYAVLPVGGYETRWFAAYEHMNVEDSLRAAEDLKCDVMIPVHWGAFHLGVEPPDYTGFRFDEIVKNNKNIADTIKLINLGEVFFLC